MNEQLMQTLLDLVTHAERSYYQDGPRCRCEWCGPYRRILQALGFDPGRGVPTGQILQARITDALNEGELLRAQLAACNTAALDKPGERERAESDPLWSRSLEAVQLLRRERDELKARALEGEKK